jgi:Glycosyl transferase family 2
MPRKDLVRRLTFLRPLYRLVPTELRRRAVDRLVGRRRPDPSEDRIDLPPRGHLWRAPEGWTPQVTVVVTAFNDSPYLGHALRSLVRQDLTDFECVVVDDASTDLTLDVAVAYARKDDRFRVVHHEGNAGLPAARNTGLGYARAEWVTFLDADDFLWPSALSRRVAAAAADPLCAGVYCDWRAVPPDADPGTKPSKPRSLQPVTFSDLRWETPFIASAPVLRTEAVRALDGFREELRSAEDFEFYLRLLRAGYWVGYTPYVGIGYRQVPGSMIRSDPAKHAEVVRSVVDSLDAELEPGAITGAVAPFTRPLSYYARESTVLRRQVRFLGLAHLTSRDEQVQRVLDLLNRDLLRLPLPFDPVEEAYSYAVQRSRLDGPEHEETRAALRRGLTESLQPLVTRPEPPVRTAPASAAEGEPVTGRRSLVAKSGRTTGVRPLGPRPDITNEGHEELARDHVLLVPQSRYHVDDLGPLSVELARRGIPTRFMVTPKAPGTVLVELAKYTDTVLSWEPLLPDRVPVAGVVVMNDWGPTRELIQSADARGAATFAKVEGVQDFADADTNQQRSAYRTARYVLAQGPYDVKALPDRDVHVVGNTRLERIWLEPPTAIGSDDPVLINFNFTYNVLTDHADSWLVSAQGGITDAGRELTVSMHPAQLNRYATAARNITAQPIRHELTRSAALVSRFSTVLYESMARGVPVIYHNPHGEKVPDFQEPRGAFLKTVDQDQLRDAVRLLPEWQVEYRARCQEFFQHQVDLDPRTPSEVRGAAVIAGLL